MRTVSVRIKIILVAMLVFTLGNLAFTLSGQVNQQPSKGGPDNKRQMAERARESKSRFPISDYNDLELTDPEKREKRKFRNERHNNSMMGVKGGLDAPPDSGDEIVIRTDWEANVPQLPAAQSDVVVVGQILDAKAYISGDKNGVYSEFTLQVNEIIKKDGVWVATPDAVITVERQGGRVRYPSGRTEWYRISLQEMPVVNHRYVLFLKRIDSDSFSILTGYELWEGRVYGLDNASQFRALDGTEETSFLTSVREATAKQ